MIKATGTFDGKPTFFIGLSHANLDKLRADGIDGAIVLHGATFGLSHDIFITAAATEAEIVNSFAEGIQPDTKITITGERQ